MKANAREGGGASGWAAGRVANNYAGLWLCGRALAARGSHDPCHCLHRFFMFVGRGGATHGLPLAHPFSIMNARSLPPPRPPITLVCVVLWRLLAWTGAWLILGCAQRTWRLHHVMSGCCACILVATGMHRPPHRRPAAFLASCLLACLLRARPHRRPALCVPGGAHAVSRPVLYEVEEG